MLSRGIAIQRANLGENNPVFAGGLSQMAMVYAATGRIDESLSLLEQVRDLTAFTLSNAFSFGSDRQRLAFLKDPQSDLDNYLSVVLAHSKNVPAVVRKACDWLLQRKALVAEATAARRDAVLEGRKPELAPRLRELAETRMQLARLILAGPAAGDVEAHSQRLEQLVVAREHLEDELARQIPELKLEHLLRNANCGAVALALPEGTAAVPASPARLRVRARPVAPRSAPVPAIPASSIHRHHCSGVRRTSWADR
jgi:hypothetical protein